MEPSHEAFKPLILRPDWKQFTISQFLWIVLCIAAFIFTAACNGSAFRTFFLYAGSVLMVYLLYQALYLARMRYVVTADQIIFLHGVFNRCTDYMEMYRVIDYQQNQSFMQQLSGLKTVVIYSGDRNSPIMRITGMKAGDNVVGAIRRRVEYNKKLKHIYEITNRL